MIQNCSVNLLFPVLQKVQTVVGLPPRKQNALMAFWHITAHEQTGSAHKERGRAQPKKILLRQIFYLKEMC